MKIPWRRWSRSEKAPAARSKAHRPTSIRFFVIGTGRCGSTLIRDILRLHPEIWVPCESHWIPLQYEFGGELTNPISFYTGIMDRVSFAGGELTVDVMASEVGVSKLDLINATRAALAREECTVGEFNDALYTAIAAAAGSSIVGDKTPDYCAYVTQLASLWPRAKFIHVIRDGRDVALSMSKHVGYQRMASLKVPNWVPLAIDKRYEMQNPLSREPSLEDYIGLWDLRIRRTLDDAKRLPARSYFELRYEKLLQDPKGQTIRLANFLDASQPQQWLEQVERIVQPGNINKVADRAIWDSLTRVAGDTLAKLSYPI